MIKTVLHLRCVKIIKIDNFFLSWAQYQTYNNHSRYAVPVHFFGIISCVNPIKVEDSDKMIQIIKKKMNILLTSRID